jgi:hypothetical protein
MICPIDVQADVLRTCLPLTRHSSLWMNDVYQSVHGDWKSGVIARASSYTAACTRPQAEAQHVSLSAWIH